MESPAMTEVMSGDDELLTEILLRLHPLRSLLAVRSVCKSWETLISSPLFVHSYNHRSTTTIRHSFIPSTFILRRSFSFSKYQLFSLSSPLPLPHIPLESFDDPDVDISSLSVSRPFDLKGRILIDQSINGLLLCRNYRTPNNIHPLKDWRRFVYNPTTNRIRQIPNPTDVFPDDPDDRFLWAFHLSFDENKSPFYKILCVGAPTLDHSHSKSESESESEPEPNSEIASFFIRIYYSETGRFEPWAGGHYFDAPSCFIYNQGVYWRNALNWVLVENGASHSLYFDVDEERLGTMPSPPDVTVDGQCSVLNDELVYLDVYLANDFQYKIYGLSSRDDDLGWSLRYTVANYLFSVVSLAYNNERGRICMLVQHERPCILVYDVESQAYDPDYRFTSYPGDCYRNQWHPAFPHTPSLASV